ncbi:MAG TPA: hypothetical protein GX506_00390 [Firmicutes bacterium]|nr:hypothetical protein [Bacillota bacterium]
MSKRLTREEIRLVARLLVEYLELQARGASEDEIEEWRARVKQAFPAEEAREAFTATIEEILRAKGYTDLERILGVAA